MDVLKRNILRLENFLTWTPLALATVIGATQIISRATVGEHLLWSEEAIIFLVIFSTYMGSAALVRDNGHIAVHVISPFVKDKGKWLMDLIGTLIATFYFGLVTYLSILLTTDPVASNTVSRVLKIPLWIIDLSVLIGFFFMAIHAIENIAILIKTKKPLPSSSEIEEAMSQIEEGSN